MAANQPKKVILHCAATPDFADGAVNEDMYDAADIDGWHRIQGWKGIGYHFVILRSGKIQEGRTTDEVGAHTKGHNEDSLGVCLMGTWKFTRVQINALIKLYYHLKDRFGIRYQQWHCHYMYNSAKSCPGISVHLLQRLLEYSDEQDVEYFQHH